MVKRVPMALAMALAWPRITVGMISTENWKTAFDAMQMKNRPSIENNTWAERWSMVRNLTYEVIK